MAKKILVDLDLAKNSLNNARVQNLASDPSSPALGQTYFNTTSNKLRTYNGTTWDEYGTSTASGTVTGVSVVAANGFDATVANPSTTPAITLKATPSGILKSNGTAMSAATQGTDYYAPGGTDVAVADGGTGASTLSGVLKGNGTSAITGGATINDLGSQTADYSANSHKITSLADPTNAQDAATKAYVDLAAAGIDWKASARAIATSNITLSGTQTIDGVSLVAGDRVLVAGQTTGANNGLYVVAAGAWSRAADADTSAEVTPGMAVFIEEGTTNADTGWVLTTNAAITLGTTSLSFVQFTGLGEVTPGTGLSKSGNTMSIDSTVATLTGAQPLTNKDLTSGTNSFPTFNQNTTGNAATATKLATARTINGVSFDGSANITIPTTTKFTATIGDGSTASIAVTDGLGTIDKIATIRDATTGAQVECDITYSSTQTTFGFAVAPATNAYKVVVIG